MTKIQIVKIANSLEMFWICFFLIWNLFVICCLSFGIYAKKSNNLNIKTLKTPYRQKQLYPSISLPLDFINGHFADLHRAGDLLRGKVVISCICFSHRYSNDEHV